MPDIRTQRSKRQRTAYVAVATLVAAVGLALVVVPWGVPVQAWTWSRLNAELGSQKLDLVRNPGNGMVGVGDLGVLDGMLFEFPAPVSPSDGGMWMLDVHRPLDAAYFAPSGELIEIDRMEPCAAEPCPVYSAPEPYLWVIETEPGVLTAKPGDELRFD